MREVALAKCFTCRRYVEVMPEYLVKGTGYEGICICGRVFRVREQDIKWVTEERARAALGYFGTRSPQEFLVFREVSA